MIFFFSFLLSRLIFSYILYINQSKIIIIIITNHSKPIFKSHNQTNFIFSNHDSKTQNTTPNSNHNSKTKSRAAYILPFYVWLFFLLCLLNFIFLTLTHHVLSFSQFILKIKFCSKLDRKIPH